MMKRTTGLAIAVAWTALSAAACQSEGRSGELGAAGAPSAERRNPARMDEASKTAMVLRQIHAENQGEIETGKLAMERAQSAEVKKFASQMVSDHTNADQKLTEYAKRANIDFGTMSQTPIEAALAQASEKAKSTLRGLSGPQFDAAYVAPQVNRHEFALDLVDQGQKLANGETKRLLDETRPVIESHLEHAKSLVRGLSFTATGVGGGPMGNEGMPGGTPPAAGRDAGMPGQQEPSRPRGNGPRPTP